MGMRVFQVHVERGRIGGADPFKSPLAAPEFHAAFEVRVENPHVILPRQLLQGQEDKGEVEAEANVMNAYRHFSTF